MGRDSEDRNKFKTVCRGGNGNAKSVLSNTIKNRQETREYVNYNTSLLAKALLTMRGS